jgi:hypothetical protein
VFIVHWAEPPVAATNAATIFVPVHFSAESAAFVILLVICDSPYGVLLCHLGIKVLQGRSLSSLYLGICSGHFGLLLVLHRYSLIRGFLLI